MKKLLFFRQFVLVTVLTSYFLSCKPERDNYVSPSDVISQDSIKIYTEFLANGGFKEEIKYRPADQGFLIGGDIFTPLTDVRSRYALSRSQRNARLKQWRNFYIVDQDFARNIKIYVSGGVPSNWNAAVTSAIEYWNNISETQVQFKRTTVQSEALIKVTTFYDASPSAAAIGDAPLIGGYPGENLRINTNGNAYSSTNSTLLRNVIAHELGHTVGLMHTDVDYINNPPPGSGSVQFISGTKQPGQDPSSIMNSSTDASKYFTNDDLIAIRTLYPFAFSSWLDRPRGDTEESATIYITWDNSVISSSATLTIALHDVANDFITTLATNVPNNGSYTVSSPHLQSKGIGDGVYRINIKETGNPSHEDSSDDPFQFLAN